tara:strand:- start:402 stop:1688 length:1287 start_codon:yes stop_codon:yes gene_type:complete
MFNHIIELKTNFNSFKTLKHIRKYYVGEVDSNNLPNGFGTCIKKYIKYTGEWKDGFPNGKGITIYKHFSLCFLTDINVDKLQTFKHEGTIKNSLFDGIGFLRRNDKLFYEGEFKKGNITGKGKLYNDKQILIYNGDFINGKFDGKGILYNTNNELLYKGEWNKGKKYGYGVLYKPNISKTIPIYDGYWKNDMFDGEGKLNERTEKRTGYFQNNKQIGSVTFYDGIRKYIGLFKDHMFNGYGTLIVNDNNNNKNSYNYLGNFLNNNFNGNGFIQYKNNNTYTGKFKNNLKDGTGSFYDYKNNYKIETTWLKDKKNGVGTILYNDGNGFKCTWRNDKLISKKRLIVYETNNLQISFKKKKEEIPYELKCPISLEIMTDPVICSDGHTYDRESIILLFKKNIFISPTTREKLNKNIIITNYNIKKMIDNFK